MDVDQFLRWVLREHGREVQELVRTKLEERSAQGDPDPGAVLREALIELHPDDFEFQPASDVLPYGFCST